MKQSEMLAALKDLRSELLRYAAESDSIVPGAYAEALDAAIETLERIRWRKVGDRPPEEGKVILTRDKYGHLRDRTLKRVGKTMLFTPDGMEPIRHITHWMPLPEPPKGENDG